MFAAHVLLATAATLAPSATDYDGGADAPTVIVTGQRDTRVRSATKTDTPLQDVPQAVSIVSRERIDDQGMRSITDVLRAVPGASVASGEGHRDAIFLRGNGSTADFFVDGIRDDVQYYRGLYNLDRVEVLKGPNAMIFGRGGGGGVVNRVTKRPTGGRRRGAISQPRQQRRVEQRDRPRNPARRRARQAASTRSTSVRQLPQSCRWPPHRLQPDARLALDGVPASICPTNLPTTAASPIAASPSQGGRPLQGAQRHFFGDPESTACASTPMSATSPSSIASATRCAGPPRRASAPMTNSIATRSAAGPVTPAGLVSMEAYQSRTSANSLFAQNDFVASLTTGPVAHTLLFGVDYSNQQTVSPTASRASSTPPARSRTSACRSHRATICRRSSSATAPRAAPPRSTARRMPSGSTSRTSSKIGDHVELIAGLRRDWFSLDTHDRVSGADFARKDSTWSPRLGLVLKPTADVSLYASWSKSFLPQSGDQFSSLTPSTAALAPETFRNREIGLKYAVTPAIDVTLAGYVLDRANTRATDPVTRLTVLTGKERSKGIEATAEGRFGHGLTLAASAALQEAVITRTTTAAVAGTHVASVPNSPVSLWGRYDASDRLGFGLGLFHQSKTFASSNAVTVPGFTRVDAAAYLGLTRQLKLQLNVENLANKKYIGLSHTDNNLTPANPRTVRAALRIAL